VDIVAPGHLLFSGPRADFRSLRGRCTDADDGCAADCGGRLTWGKDRGDWYIGIDDREFYIVPEAAIYGD